MAKVHEHLEQPWAGRIDHFGSVLSQSVEDYLKTIYLLQEDTESTVSTTDLATAMGVAPASVTNMVKKLSNLRLVEYEAYRGARLTEGGVRIALEIIRHHRLLETYLKEVLGYSWAEMHAEAERLEHHISEEFERRIDHLLGYPTHDPHGHPIPTRDGEIANRATTALSDIEPGSLRIIHHIADFDPDLLHHLETEGLLPGTDIKVVSHAPFKGPIIIRTKNTERTIGYEIARHVFVADD